MKIVYGVSGEGSGHSSRAREMATHLGTRGHDVWLVSYGRGYRNLRDDFHVFETEGLSIASEDNKVSIVKTLMENLLKLPDGFGKLQQLRQTVFREFQPDCVITDFEPMTAYLANHFDLPLITIDNQHRLRYIDYECPRHLEFDSQVTRNIVRAMIPRPDVSLVTTFCRGPTRNERTFLFSPIVRREVRQSVSRDGDHILVYLTQGFGSLLRLLPSFDRERFFVYGYDRSDQEGCVRYRPFSRDGFLNDLSAAKGVIATAGFTLISEALYLKKPYLALPMQGQFEQELNGFQLSQLGFGKSVSSITEESIGDFLYRLPEYRARLAAYEPDDNGPIVTKLDELLADGARLACEYHRTRM